MGKHEHHGHHGGHGHGHKFDPANLDKLKDPERLRWLNPEGVWEVIAGRLAPAPPRVVVDVGVGLGFFALPFARRMPEGRVYGCDIREDMLGHLRQVLTHEQVGNVEPLLSQEVEIPLEAGLADLVFMANLHHELDFPLASLGEALRLLRPGGAIAIIDWKPEETPSGPPLEVRLAPDTVRAQLTEAGFGEVAMHDLLPYHYFVTALKPAG